MSETWDDANAIGSNERVDEKSHLSALLESKLQGIPRYHIPSLNLRDIIEQSPRASHFSNIPADLQLPFLLRHRALINHHANKAIEVDAQQPINITRAIFYYRLDEAHQFQRYHDTSRWNLTIFTALLALPHDDPAPPPLVPTTGVRNMKKRRHPWRDPLLKDTYIPRAARRFMVMYIDAVLEHHNTPSTFTAREAFIRLWKDNIWDVFDKFAAAQKKAMKRLMKDLAPLWEEELDQAMERMGQKDYERCVAPLVGSLIPGRKDQGLPAALQYPGLVSLVSTSDLGASMDVNKGVGSPLELSGHVKNELLEALQVPLEMREEIEDYAEKRSYRETSTLVDPRYAVAVAQEMLPEQILPVLLRVFPPHDG